MTFKIGFVGAASVGKDTTIHGVAHLLKMNKINVDVLPESARMALYHGFNLDRKSTVGTAIYILGLQLMNEAITMENNKVEVLLCNRTTLDGIVYGKYYMNDTEYNNYCDAEWSLLPLHKYNLIINLMPFRELVDDGIRDMDTKYNAQTMNDFDNLIKELKIKGYNAITIGEKQMQLRTQQIFDLIIKEMQKDVMRGEN